MKIQPLLVGFLYCLIPSFCLAATAGHDFKNPDDHPTSSVILGAATNPSGQAEHIEMTDLPDPRKSTAPSTRNQGPENLTDELCNIFEKNQHLLSLAGGEVKFWFRGHEVTITATVIFLGGTIIFQVLEYYMPGSGLLPYSITSGVLGVLSHANTWWTFNHVKTGVQSIVDAIKRKKATSKV